MMWTDVLHKEEEEENESTVSFSTLGNIGRSLEGQVR